MMHINIDLLKDNKKILKSSNLITPMKPIEEKMATTFFSVEVLNFSKTNSLSKTFNFLYPNFKKKNNYLVLDVSSPLTQKAPGIKLESVSP